MVVCTLQISIAADPTITAPTLTPPELKLLHCSLPTPEVSHSNVVTKFYAHTVYEIQK